MIGQTVQHPDYGEGVVLATFRGGSECLVRFASGLRFRRPREEFVGQEAQLHKPKIGTFQPAAPMPLGQYAARQLIEALRFGVAPAQYASDLSIGLAQERAHIASALRQSSEQGGAVTVVVGDYGQGKSHLVELASQTALKENYLVASVSLDLSELPPHRAFAIYSSLVSKLRYPDSEDRGLEPLFERVIQQPQLEVAFGALADGPIDPLSLAVMALSKTASTRQRRQWQAFIERGQRVYALQKAVPEGQKFPSIYKVGHHARQIAYLLSGVASLARLAGYQGLAVMIDEAESYSLLAKYQRPKASDFFQALIYAALQSQQHSIQADDLPQHRFRDYPAAFPLASQGLYFLFTVTRSDNPLPLEDWLSDEHIIELGAHHSAKELSQFLTQLEHYHSVAFAYSPAERHGQLRRIAAEHLALASQQNRLSIRGLVRLSVDLYDLLYLYEELAVTELVSDLKRALWLS